MKINIFVSTRNGGKFADNNLVHSSITGERAVGPDAPEDDLINEIDESRMSLEKALAIRFLTFLSHRYISVQLLGHLSPEEQRRLKKEFIEG